MPYPQPKPASQSGIRRTPQVALALRPPSETLHPQPRIEKLGNVAPGNARMCGLGGLRAQDDGDVGLPIKA